MGLEAACILTSPLQLQLRAYHVHLVPSDPKGRLCESSRFTCNSGTMVSRVQTTASAVHNLYSAAVPPLKSSNYSFFFKCLEAILLMDRTASTLNISRNLSVNSFYLPLSTLDEMDWVCSTNSENRNAYRILVGKEEVTRSLGRPILILKY
jgi:hypothetical protein